MKVITIFVIQCLAFASTQWTSNMCVGKMDGIVFPDQTDCDSFFICQRGATTQQKCQPGTSFDLNLYYCVPSHATNCGSRSRPNIPPTSGDSPPSSESHHSVCRNVRNGALIENPQNCRAYIECQQNLRLDRECQSGELFETKSGVCLSDFAVDCGNRKISPSNDDALMRNVCRNQRNGARVDDPRNCRFFITCFNQQGTGDECRDGELFETNLKRCVNKGAVQCGRRPINGREIDLNGQISSSICNGLPAGTRISNPSDCQKYYECQNNQRHDLSCPSNQAFDMVSNQCRVSSAVSCGSRGISNRNPQTVGVCVGQANNRRLANQNNCRAFIECQANTQIDKSCDSGTLFDEQMEKCLAANTVRCGSRRIPPSDSEPQSPEDFFPPCPRSGVVFRSHPHDCEAYFICAEGKLIQHSCAAGIFFNSDTLRCDFPQNVQCRLTRIVVPQTPLLPDCSSGANFFPNLVNCKQYYKCVNNLPQLVDCPNGYLWNNLLLKCDRSDSEICARQIDSFMGGYIHSRPNFKEKKF